jgi:hypothetical protein
VATVTLRIQVFHANYDGGAAVMQQVKATFDRSDFALAGSDVVVDMRRVNDSERQNDDGVWQFICDFQCTVHLATGV